MSRLPKLSLLVSLLFLSSCSLFKELSSDEGIVRNIEFQQAVGDD